MCFECFLGDHQCGVVSPHQRENISTNDRGEISLVASNPIPVDNDLSHTALSLCCNWITGVAISRYGIKLDRERSDNPLASTSTSACTYWRRTTIFLSPSIICHCCIWPLRCFEFHRFRSRIWLLIVGKLYQNSKCNYFHFKNNLIRSPSFTKYFTEKPSS